MNISNVEFLGILLHDVGGVISLFKLPRIVQTILRLDMMFGCSTEINRPVLTALLVFGTFNRYLFSSNSLIPLSHEPSAEARRYTDHSFRHRIVHIVERTSSC